MNQSAHDDSKIDVFISYSRKDMRALDVLTTHLKCKGISFWVDREELKGGSRWRRELGAAILRSRLLVLLYSPASAASKEVYHEVAYALHEGINIIPLQLGAVKKEDSLIDYLIFDRQRIDGSDPPSPAQLERLTKDILALLGVDRLPPVIEPLSPIGPLELSIGESLRLTWRVVTPPGSRIARIGLDLLQNGKSLRGLPSDGVFLADGTSAMDWTVPLDISPGKGYGIRITVWDGWGHVASAQLPAAIAIRSNLTAAPAPEKPAETASDLTDSQSSDIPSIDAPSAAAEPREESAQPKPTPTLKWASLVSSQLFAGRTYLCDVEIEGEVSNESARELRLSIVSGEEQKQAIATFSADQLAALRTDDRSVIMVRQAWSIAAGDPKFVTGNRYRLRAELFNSSGEMAAELAAEFTLTAPPVAPIPWAIDPLDRAIPAAILTTVGLGLLALLSQEVRILMQIDYGETHLGDIGRHIFYGFIAALTGNWLIVVVASAITTIGVFLGDSIANFRRILGNMISGAAIGASICLALNLAFYAPGPHRPTRTMPPNWTTQKLAERIKQNQATNRATLPAAEKPSASEALPSKEALSKDADSPARVDSSPKQDISSFPSDRRLTKPEPTPQELEATRIADEKAEREHWESETQAQRVWSLTPVKGAWNSMLLGALLGLFFGLLAGGRDE